MEEQSLPLRGTQTALASASMYDAIDIVSKITRKKKHLLVLTRAAKL